MSATLPVREMVLSPVSTAMFPLTVANRTPLLAGSVKVTWTLPVPASTSETTMPVMGPVVSSLRLITPGRLS